LAERKILDLDVPITRYLTGAQWGKGVNPDSITLRRLLCHTHGIEGEGPVIWRTAYTGVHTNDLLKKLLRHHGASGTGRDYRYSNIGYNIAGLAIDDATGGTWQDALEQNVLKPVGMTGTTAYVSRFDSARLAMPYILDPAGPRRAHYAKRDENMQAAGGLVSTAADLAKWLEAQINEGRLNGRQVFPRHVVAETQRQQTTMTGKRGEIRTVGYALGWTIGLQGSDTVLLHGGGFSTFQTLVAFDPRNRIGVAVAANEAVMGGGALEVISEYTLESGRDRAAAKEKYAPWLTELPAIMERVKARIAEDRARRGARPQALNKPLEAYAGTYESEQGGVMKWSVREGRLWVEIGVLKSIAEVYDNQKDLLRVELVPGTGKVVQFNFENGRATGIIFDRMEYARR
jgi:CubicO group peptidase (beta-lactamase class C family)